MYNVYIYIYIYVYIKTICMTFNRVCITKKPETFSSIAIWVFQLVGWSCWMLSGDEQVEQLSSLFGIRALVTRLGFRIFWVQHIVCSCIKKTKHTQKKSRWASSQANFLRIELLDDNIITWQQTTRSCSAPLWNS